MSADYEQVYENLQWTDWHAAVEWQQQWYEEARLKWYAAHAKYAAPQRGQPSAANRNYSLEADCEWRKWYLGRRHEISREAGSASPHAKAKSAPAAESNASPSQPLVPKAKAASVPAVKAPPSPKAKATSSPKAKAKSSPNVTAASPPTPTQHSQPDVWQRRCRHRLAGVAAVKRSSEYINVLMNEAEHSLARPSSPDPHDESLSKRQWERGMQAWRTQLADLVDMRCYQCVN